MACVLRIAFVAALAAFVSMTTDISWSNSNLMNSTLLDSTACASCAKLAIFTPSKLLTIVL